MIITLSVNFTLHIRSHRLDFRLVEIFIELTILKPQFIIYSAMAMAVSKEGGPVTTLVIGHSFTRRVRDWCVTEGLHNLNLNSELFTVFMHGVGGGVVLNRYAKKSLWHDLHLIPDLNATSVVIDLGSNDLCHASVSAAQLVQGITAFATECLIKGATHVTILEILPRLGTLHFNARVAQANTMILQFTESRNDLYFWKHCRNNFSNRFLSDFIAPDGIHVCSSRGMRHYYRSVRGAVLWASKGSRIGRIHNAIRTCLSEFFFAWYL